MKKEQIEKYVNKARVVAAQAFARLAFWFKKLVDGMKAMARWLADKTCAAINLLKEKARKKKEEVASVPTLNETSEKAESPEKESDSHSAEVEAPKGESKDPEGESKDSEGKPKDPEGEPKEEKKRIVSFKVKKSVPARMATRDPASVAKPAPAPEDEPTPAPEDEPASAPVDEPASAPEDEPASHAPATAQPAESSSDEQPVDDRGSFRVKSSTHGLRQKKNRPGLANGANGLSLRRDSRFASANTNDETASSTLRGRLDLGMVCFLGFGVGMAIIGGCLGYGTCKLLSECIDGSIMFMGPILLTSAFVTSTMLVWALYLGMLTNGRQGFATTFKGWVTVIAITILVLTYIGGKQRNEFRKEMEEMKNQKREQESLRRAQEAVDRLWN